MRSDGGVRGPLYTPLSDALKWFSENEIPLFGVNANPEQKTWTDSPKAYATTYIYDAALGAPLVKGLDGERDYIDWDAVRVMILGNLIEEA